mmetsp:Transcript_67463/g.195374  ORF Transcript_67463/g.195374 Transcript_67463/m.195374 type:complete len:375 (-) Transcript_67463:1232-2356(-)
MRPAIPPSGRFFQPLISGTPRGGFTVLAAAPWDVGTSPARLTVGRFSEGDRVAASVTFLRSSAAFAFAAAAKAAARFSSATLRRFSSAAACAAFRSSAAFCLSATSAACFAFNSSAALRRFSSSAFCAVFFSSAAFRRSSASAACFAFSSMALRRSSASAACFAFSSAALRLSSAACAACRSAVLSTDGATGLGLSIFGISNFGTSTFGVGIEKENPPCRPRKYLDPELVLTTFPLVAPFATGEVVMISPCLKLFDPVIAPVIEPSSFCFQFESVGTPGGACDDVGVACLGGEAFSSSVFPRLKRSPKDIVRRGAADCKDCSAALACFFFSASNFALAASAAASLSAFCFAISCSRFLFASSAAACFLASSSSR